MKLAIFGSALFLTQALVASEAWASGKGAAPGGSAGFVHWLSENIVLATGLAGVAVLALIMGGVAGFRMSRSDDPFNPATNSTTSEPH